MSKAGIYIASFLAEDVLPPCLKQKNPNATWEREDLQKCQAMSEQPPYWWTSEITAIVPADVIEEFRKNDANEGKFDGDLPEIDAAYPLPPREHNSFVRNNSAELWGKTVLRDWVKKHSFCAKYPCLHLLADYELQYELSIVATSCLNAVEDGEETIMGNKMSTVLRRKKMPKGIENWKTRPLPVVTNVLPHGWGVS